MLKGVGCRDEGITTDMSYLDSYADRMNLKPECAPLNFLTFCANYSVANGKIVKRKNTVVVKTFPSYSGNPKGKNYGLYCKYQLIRYKNWIDKPSNVWNDQEEYDEHLVQAWLDFLDSEEGKNSFPNWEKEIFQAEQYTLQSDEEFIEKPTDCGKEEWMHLAELSTKYISNQNGKLNSTLTQKALLEYSSLYSNDQIQAMPFWIERMKSENLMPLRAQQFDFSKDKLNKEQLFAYNLIESHFHSTSTTKPLKMILTGQGGSGKSYLINGFRNLFGKACSVLSYFGIAAFNVKGKLFIAFFNFQFVGEIKAY